MSRKTHRLSFHEGPDQVSTEDSLAGEGPILRRPYTVLTEIFKRGRIWAVGETIDLDPGTGESFKALGEVEEANTSDEKSPK